MNIMLVSVSEHTREIGIRMAVGARPSNVRIQFLTEAVVLSLLGGVIGISSGVGISKAITQFFAWPTVISIKSIVIAVGFSAFVGVFFGFWPAWKASNLDSIDNQPSHTRGFSHELDGLVIFPYLLFLSYSVKCRPVVSLPL